MEVVEKVVKVPKSASAVADALLKVYRVGKQQLADGWQAGGDIGPIVSVILGELLPSMQAGAQLPADAKEDAVGVAEAFLLAVLEEVRK